MSPASYLAAPPRDAGPIVAPVFRPATIRGVWNWAIYGALSLGFLAGSGAAALADGRVDEVHRETRITRLGEGVDERRRLLPVPIARVRNVLADYRRTLESLGSERTLLVATSAVRDAENGEAFLGEIEWSYGFDTELLTGDEEAAMTLRGVSVGRALEPGTLLLDVGGGSTELTLPDFRVSLDVGSVRLTERFLASDPPPAADSAPGPPPVRPGLRGTRAPPGRA